MGNPCLYLGNADEDVAEPNMQLKNAFLAPINLAALATQAKSFRANPVLGSPVLNRWGLHIARCQLAEQMAGIRRWQMTRLMSKTERETFHEQGYVLIENVLPEAVFRDLTEEVETTRFPSCEERHGEVATRWITLSPSVLAGTPALKSFVEGDLLQNTMRYISASNRRPLVRIQTVMTDTTRGTLNDVTTLHSDTFQPNAKGWIFLRDVTREDGPFAFVPGSHRMTSDRIAWEFEQSLSAANAENGIHANGSFRITEAALLNMGLGPAKEFTVKANSMVIADTRGFHARRPSLRPSVRIAVYAALRSNPFTPIPGFDPFDLPGFRHQKGPALDQLRWRMARLTGKRVRQPLVGDFLAGDPPSL
jgi:ectoine hydroxylase-related dioxygenase (phytanoyl-CoA dioxygenase family)